MASPSTEDVDGSVHRYVIVMSVCWCLIMINMNAMWCLAGCTAAVKALSHTRGPSAGMGVSICYYNTGGVRVYSIYCPLQTVPTA